MKALKYFFFIILIALIAGFIYISVQPSTYAFSRSKIIEAPKPVVFNLVNNFKSWPRFSPWLEQDNEAILTYNEIAIGLNSAYSWNGAVLGEGNMKTIGVNANDSINQKIEFIKPFESNSNINWYFEDTKEGTKVTWEMNGKQDFMTKMYTAFNGSIEENTAKDFDRGLFKLDSIAKVDIKKYDVVVNGVTKYAGGFHLYNTTATSMVNFKSKMQSMIEELMTFAGRNRIKTSGNLFVIYHKWDTENNSVMFSCALPTPNKIVSTDTSILTGQLAPFKALKTTLTGDYSNLQEAWNKAMSHIKENNLTQDENGVSIESYLNTPVRTPNPANLITEIFIPLKEAK